MINFKEYTTDKRFNLLVEKLVDNFKMFGKEIRSDVESKVWGYGGSPYNEFCSGSVTIETPLNTSNFYYGSFVGLPKNNMTRYIKDVVKLNVEFMKKDYENRKDDFESFEEFEEDWFYERMNDYLINILLRVYFINSHNSYYVTNQKLNKWLQKDNLAIGVELAVKHCDSIFTLEIGEFYKRLRYIKLNKENILENYQDIEDVLNSYKEVYKKYFSRG